MVWCYMSENIDAHFTVCPSCESENLSHDDHESVFPYGIGADAVNLSAIGLVHTCLDCNESFISENMAMSCHNAVCDHFGLLTPSQVRKVRGAMSPEEFSELTGIGRASLFRWEGGKSLQSVAYDRFLRLLTFTENIARLKTYQK